MAERRMISKSISVSEKVNAMSVFARLLFTWMIPHADDFGRLPGSPMKVRALVVPMADETKTDVENALKEMVQQKLIQWYTVEGTQYIQINNFEKHQTGLHKRTKSKYPEPNETDHKPSSQPFPEIPGNSEIYRHEQKRTEEKRTEEKGTEQKRKVQILESKGDDPDELQSPGRNIDWTVVEEDVHPDDINPIKQIEERYIQRRGIGIIPSQKDYEAMKRVLEQKIPLQDILEGIDHAFDTFAPKHPRDRINSFKYCEAVIVDFYHRKKARQTAHEQAGALAREEQRQSTSSKQPINEEDLAEKRARINAKLKIMDEKLKKRKQANGTEVV